MQHQVKSKLNLLLFSRTLYTPLWISFWITHLMSKINNFQWNYQTPYSELNEGSKYSWISLCTVQRKLETRFEGFSFCSLIRIKAQWLNSFQKMWPFRTNEENLRLNNNAIKTILFHSLNMSTYPLLSHRDLGILTSLI